MTNKTIIDGIDVSKCKYLTTANGCDCADTTSFECIRVDNCFFKQLARAKEEIEKWKHQAKLGSDTTDRLSKQLEQKEQENETLKSENFTFEELIKIQDNLIDKYKQDNLIDKYKQALESIMEICQIEEENNRYSCPYSFRKIQDIITKAKDGE